MERAEPATNLALQAFVSLHDSLVVSPAYKSALNTTASTLTYASTTTPYKLGAQYVYPIVKPVAEPAITKVTHSKIFGQVRTRQHSVRFEGGRLLVVPLCSTV